MAKMRGLLGRIVLLLTSWIVASASQGSPAADEKRQARAADIRKTLDAVNQELAANGGSLQTWGEKLKPFREDVKQVIAIFRPIKGNLRISSQELEMLLLDAMDGMPADQQVFQAVLHLDQQLKARGIDLYTTYRDFRNETKKKVPLYYETQDIHWRNKAAQLCGERIAERLKRYAFVRQALAAGNPFKGEPFKRDGTKADLVLAVVDAKTGGHYVDVPDSPVVLSADSYGTYGCGCVMPEGGDSREKTTWRDCVFDWHDIADRPAYNAHMDDRGWALACRTTETGSFS